MRFPAETKKITITMDAEIVDESYGGLGILIDTPSLWPEGTEVSIMYCGIPVRAIVRRTQQEDEKCRIGLQWAACSRVSTSSFRSQAEYLFIDGLGILCDVVTRKDNEVEARLPDGTEICFSQDLLSSMTSADRKTELESYGSELTLLMGVYRLGTVASRQDAIEAILAFEFATEQGGDLPN